MLTAYLLDDERLATERLTRLIEADSRLTIVGASSDPVEAIAQIGNLKPDLLFLDIEMPEKNGFQVLHELSRQPLVIFATAYDRYALQAFDTNSVAYLLKPISPESLTKAIDKIVAIRGGGQPKPDLDALLAQLASRIAPPARYPERISSRTGDKVEFIDLSRVTHLYAEDKLTFVSTEVKNHIVDQTIAELESKLDPAKFLRVHRSTIVNLGFVSELYTYFGGKLMLRLKDKKQTEITVSKERAPELRKKLGL